MAFALFVSGTSMAQEFRIESSVYDDSSKLPISQTTTLFSQSVVYDFQLSNDAQPRVLEIAIYDSRRQMMILLDTQRRMKLELSDLRLLKIEDAIRRQTLEDNRSSFLVKDEFEQDIDWSTNWVTLTSSQIEYRFKGGQPANVAIIPAYTQFLDNFTRLNVTDPTKYPPFARMKVNQSIKRLGWIPDEVRISVKQNSLFRKPFSAKSKHVLVTQLSKGDHARIATAKQHWMQFESVDLTEYRGLPENPRFKLPKVSVASHEESIEGNHSSTKRN